MTAMRANGFHARIFTHALTQRLNSASSRTRLALIANKGDRLTDTAVGSSIFRQREAVYAGPRL